MSTQMALDLAPDRDRLELHPQPGRDLHAAQHSIDELVAEARQYRTSAAYAELLEFVARFRSYSPFNAMLVHVQLPGATFVAPAHRWRCKFLRRVRPGARPLVILQPRGPVMFVYDVSDTEPEQGAPELPGGVRMPFEATMRRSVVDVMRPTIANARRDGVRVTFVPAGSQSAGQVRGAAPGLTMEFAVGRPPDVRPTNVPIRYELEVNSGHAELVQFTTLVHELGHLYCGHLGRPKAPWFWPDRRDLDRETAEFEAESVNYLVCKRLDSEARLPPYLAGFMSKQLEIPSLSLMRVLTAAHEIEQMGKGRLPLRKPKR
jgi:hypothetical protein